MKFKFQFFTIIAVVFLITAFLFFNIYKEVENETKQQLGEQLKTHAKLASKGIIQFFTDYYNDLAFLSKIDKIINVDKDTEDILLDYFENHSDYVSAITRIDSEGRIIKTVPVVNSVIGMDVSDQAHNKKVMETQEPVISDVFEAVQGYNTIALAYPIFNDSIYDGCISLLIPFEHVSSLFLENIHVGQSGYAWMISHDGVELYCKTDDHIGQNYTSNNHNFSIEMIENTPSEFLGSRMDGNLNNQKSLAYFYPVILGDNSWSIIVTVPENEVFSITNGFRNKLLLIALSFLSLSILFSYLYYRRKLNIAKNIREQKDLFSTIGKETGLILYDYDISTDNIEWSGAIESTLGYSEKELNQFTIKEWKELIHPADMDIMKKLQDAIDKNENFDTEYRCKNKNGEYLFIEDNGIILKSDGEKSMRLVGIMKDITDRKIVEQELIQNKNNLEEIVKARTEELNQKNIELEKDIKKRQRIEIELRKAKEQAEVSDKLKSEFLAQMSHEIRTPISTIMNFTTLLKMEFEGKTSEENSHSFSAIENAADRLLRTIDLVLNLSDIEAGTYKPHIIDIDLKEHILSPLINEFKIIAGRKKLELVFNYDPDIKPIKLDRYTITQIFANLIDNAIKYTNEGLITINLIQNSEYYNCEIIDTGIGISEEYLPRLFEVFSQEEQGYTRKYDGSGLGLALVKNYCSINNAVIQVESKKGSGSKFTVKIKK